MTISVDAAGPAPGVARSAVRVLFFGRIADACGRSMTVPIPSEGCSLAELKGRVARQVDGGATTLGHPCVRVAIDQVMAGHDPWVSPGQEVAFLSAFSGG
jgi:molybdopterin converting factor small subunit